MNLLLSDCCTLSEKLYVLNCPTLNLLEAHECQDGIDDATVMMEKVLRA